MMLQLLGQCFHIEFADANGQPSGTTTAVKPIMFTFSRTRSRLFHVLSVGEVRQPCQKKLRVLTKSVQDRVSSVLVI